jgi:hypothetical protein
MMNRQSMTADARFLPVNSARHLERILAQITPVVRVTALHVVAHGFAFSVAGKIPCQKWGLPLL